MCTLAPQSLGQRTEGNYLCLENILSFDDMSASSSELDTIPLQSVRREAFYLHGEEKNIKDWRRK